MGLLYDSKSTKLQILQHLHEPKMFLYCRPSLSHVFSAHSVLGKIFLLNNLFMRIFPHKGEDMLLGAIVINSEAVAGSSYQVKQIT